MAASLILGGIALGGAGLQLWGAHKQGKAAEKAAAQQVEGVREARAYAEPLYDRARAEAGQIFERGQAGLAPYAQQGTQGLMALSDFLGVPRAPAAPVAKPVAQGAPVGAPAAPVGAPRYMPPSGVPTGDYAVPRPGTPAAARPPATQSSYVMLQAPTGQTQAVPPDQVGFYLSRGARRV